MFDYLDYMGFKTNKMAQDADLMESIICDAVEAAEDGDDEFEFDANLLDDDEVEYIKAEIRRRLS